MRSFEAFDVHGAVGIEKTNPSGLRLLGSGYEVVRSEVKSRPVLTMGLIVFLWQRDIGICIAQNLIFWYVFSWQRLQLPCPLLFP